jgi:hypothetical protein
MSTRKSRLVDVKVDEPVLLIHAISSLDDAIDFANTRYVKKILFSGIY